MHMKAQSHGRYWNDLTLKHGITSKFTFSVISLGDLVGWTLMILQAVQHAQRLLMCQMHHIDNQFVVSHTSDGKQSELVGKAPYCSHSSQRTMFEVERS